MAHAIPDHDDHPSHLQHHFYTSDQQFSAAKFGMWLFLAQELLFFSGVFVGYIAYRFFYYDMFLDAHMQLSVFAGSLNTLVLLTSSLTMVLAVRAAQLGNQKWLVRHLGITFLLAGVFLVVKYFEYSSKWEHGLIPIVGETPETSYWNHAYAIEIFGAQAEQARIYFAFYFTMTGLHGLHVIIGMGLIAWIMIRGAQGAYGPDYYTPVENVGLYWHLVDLIWIYLFPLLYLVK